MLGHHTALLLAGDLRPVAPQEVLLTDRGILRGEQPMLLEPVRGWFV